MRYFSMFSGIGGFESGIKKAEWKKWECIGYSEINKYAISIYQKHFPGHVNFGDATRIVPETIPDFDLLCGGFPCQAFSIAGKRGGFKDTRGTLFFEVARVVSVKRPKLLLLENVAGLLSHDKGKTFGTILSTLSELGYFCEWQVLNSKDFGVPQNRERVYIIGHSGKGSGRKIFPITKSCEGNSQSYQEEQRNGERVRGDVAQSLRERDYKGGNNLIKYSQKLPDAQRIRETIGISSTLKGEGGGQGAKTGLYAIPVLTPDRSEKNQNGRRMKEDGDDSFTLTSTDVHGVYDGMRIRRLTPTECERLQGFPDGWTKFGISTKEKDIGKRYGTNAEGNIHYQISDSQRYKVLGNSVTTNVIEAIIKKIIEVKP